MAVTASPCLATLSQKGKTCRSRVESVSVVDILYAPTGFDALSRPNEARGHSLARDVADDRQWSDQSCPDSPRNALRCSNNLPPGGIRSRAVRVARRQRIQSARRIRSKPIQGARRSCSTRRVLRRPSMRGHNQPTALSAGKYASRSLALQPATAHRRQYQGWQFMAAGLADSATECTC